MDSMVAHPGHLAPYGAMLNGSPPPYFQSFTR